MDSSGDALDHLDETECWERLGRQDLGRLVTQVGGVLDVFPVNYVTDEREIVFRTAEGTKLLGLTINDEVLFEADDHTDEDAWSVVVRGRARVSDASEELLRAEALGLRPWAPTVKYNVVRIEADRVSGRAFLRGPEPQGEGVPNV